MMHTRAEKVEAFGRLLDVMDTLREQCPWDRKQTNESLRTNSIEEVYELAEALLRNSATEIKKELGDVLLHVVFYAKIGEEKGLYDIASICDALCEKLIYRHPHIYGQTKADTAEAVESKWEELKLREKDGNKSTLSGVPASLPSIVKAVRMQEKARGVGFDWEKREDVWLKVQEEVQEVVDAIEQKDTKAIESEFGDLLFAVINAARLYNINPDNALERTNQKFLQRFGYLEEKTKQNGRQLKDMTLHEMEELWIEAKQIEQEQQSAPIDNSHG